MALLHGWAIRFIHTFKSAAKTLGLSCSSNRFTVALSGCSATHPTVDVQRALQAVIVTAIVSGARPLCTLPFLSYLASVVISMFVPSRSGHWACPRLGSGQRNNPTRSRLTEIPGQDRYGSCQRPSRRQHDSAILATSLFAVSALDVRQVMGFTVVAFRLGFVVLGAASPLMPFL